jgi:hypothetical protein
LKKFLFLVTAAILNGGPAVEQKLKETHPGTIPARFGLIWFSGFRGEDLNVIFFELLPIMQIRKKGG